MEGMMSAEGKKKRGISGVANAKNIPFRYGNNGWRPPMEPGAVQPRKRNTETARGIFGGIVAAKLGFAMVPLSFQMLTWLEADCERECPVVGASIYALSA
jgi:hypothetical protein